MSKSRNNRRKVEINVNGENVNAHKFLTERAKVLPRMIDRETGKAINHEENLKAIFDQLGTKGVNLYVGSVCAVSVRDKGGLKNKIKGYWLILKSKVKLWVK